MYEKEEKLKVGLEAYYFSRQKLTDGTFRKTLLDHRVNGRKIMGVIFTFHQL
jgi:hypothetical protein